LPLFVGDILCQSSGFGSGGPGVCGVGSWAGSGRMVSGCGFFSFHFRCCVFDIVNQFAGLFGFGSLRVSGECLWDGDCSSVAAAGATRDSNSESPTCGRLGILVAWSMELGGLCGLGDSRRCMGGKAGDGGDLLGGKALNRVREFLFWPASWGN